MSVVTVWALDPDDSIYNRIEDLGEGSGECRILLMEGPAALLQAATDPSEPRPDLVIVDSGYLAAPHGQTHGSVARLRWQALLRFLSGRPLLLVSTGDPSQVLVEAGFVAALTVRKILRRPFDGESLGQAIVESLTSAPQLIAEAAYVERAAVVSPLGDLAEEPPAPQSMTEIGLDHQPETIPQDVTADDSYLSFDDEKRLVSTGDGTSVHLTPIAFRLLRVLWTASAHEASRETLLASVWGGLGVGPKVLDVQICTMRKKVAALRIEIASVRSYGYRVSVVTTTQQDSGGGDVAA